MLPIRFLARSGSRYCSSSVLVSTTVATSTCSQQSSVWKVLAARTLGPRGNNGCCGQPYSYSTEAAVSSKPDTHPSRVNETVHISSNNVAAAEEIKSEESGHEVSVKSKKNFKSSQLQGQSSNIALQKSNIELDKLYKSIELEVLAYEPSVLDSYQWFVITAATHLGITVGKCWAPLKSQKERFALLKSAFVHKKHQVQYEIRTYHRFLTFHKLTGSTADTFLEYVERNLPEGVGLKVTRVEAQPLPGYLQKKHSSPEESSS
jgi:small subunit ribosomal protein S10